MVALVRFGHRHEANLSHTEARPERMPPFTSALRERGAYVKDRRGAYSPDRENASGARWNPAGVAAIYASVTHEGAIAEAEHQIAVQSIRSRVQRNLR